MLPLHEDCGESSLPRQALGEGEAEQELRQGHDADQREPRLLGGIRQTEVQAETVENYTIFDKNEETEAEETEEDCSRPEKG